MGFFAREGEVFVQVILVPFFYFIYFLFYLPPHSLSVLAYADF